MSALERLTPQMREAFDKLSLTEIPDVMAALGELMQKRPDDNFSEVSTAARKRARSTDTRDNSVPRRSSRLSSQAQASTPRSAVEEIVKDKLTRSASSARNKQKSVSKDSRNVASAPPSKANTFPFLQLPAELRNEIYRLVLLPNHTSPYKGIRGRIELDEFGAPHQRPWSLNLLRTCSQINEEGSHILYTEATLSGSIFEYLGYKDGVLGICRDDVTMDSFPDSDSFEDMALDGLRPERGNCLFTRFRHAIDVVARFRNLDLTVFLDPQFPSLRQYTAVASRLTKLVAAIQKENKSNPKPMKIALHWAMWDPESDRIAMQDESELYFTWKKIRATAQTLEWPFEKLRNVDLMRCEELFMGGYEFTENKMECGPDEYHKVYENTFGHIHEVAHFCRPRHADSDDEDEDDDDDLDVEDDDMDVGDDEVEEDEDEGAADPLNHSTLIAAAMHHMATAHPELDEDELIDQIHHHHHHHD